MDWKITFGGELWREGLSGEYAKSTIPSLSTLYPDETWVLTSPSGLSQVWRNGKPDKIDPFEEGVLV